MLQKTIEALVAFGLHGERPTGGQINSLWKKLYRFCSQSISDRFLLCLPIVDDKWMIWQAMNLFVGLHRDIWGHHLNAMVDHRAFPASKGWQVLSMPTPKFCHLPCVHRLHRFLAYGRPLGLLDLLLLVHQQHWQERPSSIWGWKLSVGFKDGIRRFKQVKHFFGNCMFKVFWILIL